MQTWAKRRAGIGLDASSLWTAHFRQALFCKVYQRGLTVKQKRMYCRRGRINGELTDSYRLNVTWPPLLYTDQRLAGIVTRRWLWSQLSQRAVPAKQKVKSHKRNTHSFGFVHYIIITQWKRWHNNDHFRVTVVSVAVRLLQTNRQSDLRTSLTMGHGSPAILHSSLPTR